MIVARTQMENNIKSFRARVLSNAANGDVSCAEWEFDLDFGVGPTPHAEERVMTHWRPSPR